MKKKIHSKTLLELHRIERQRITTAEFLQRRSFPHLKRAGVESWLQRRVQNEHLTSNRLFGPWVYYTVTGKSVSLLKRAGFPVSRHAIRPLGPEAKRHWYAFLHFCNPVKGPNRSPYRPSLDPDRFPTLTARVASGTPDPHRRQTFFRQGKDVGFFVVDRGQPDFVSRKIRPKLFKLMTRDKHPEMRALLDKGQFRLAIASASASRAAQLRMQLEAPKPPFPFEVHVVEELIHFVVDDQCIEPPMC